MSNTDTTAEASTTGRLVKGESLPSGTEFGGYRIGDVIGVGAMGTVYRAEHGVLGKQVALKLMAPALRSDTEARRRFLLEAKTTAAIKHRHVIEVVDFGECGGNPYIVMELLEGEDQESYLDAQTCLSSEDAQSFQAESETTIPAPTSALEPPAPAPAPSISTPAASTSAPEQPDTCGPLVPLRIPVSVPDGPEPETGVATPLQAPTRASDGALAKHALQPTTRAQRRMIAPQRPPRTALTARVRTVAASSSSAAGDPSRPPETRNEPPDVAVSSRSLPTASDPRDLDGMGANEAPIFD